MSNIVINVPKPKSPIPEGTYEYAGYETWGRRELVDAIYGLGHTPLLTRGRDAYDLDKGVANVFRLEPGSNCVTPDVIDIDTIGAIRNIGNVIDPNGELNELNHPSVRGITKNPDRARSVLEMSGVVIGAEYEEEPILRAFVFGKSDEGKLHTRYALMRNPSNPSDPNWKFVNEEQAREDHGEQVEAIHDLIQEETGAPEIHMAIDFSVSRLSVSPRALKLREPTLVYRKDHKQIGNQHAYLLARQLVRLANK